MSESRRAILVEKWRRRIGEHRSSGRTVAAFCRERGLAENSFYVWKRRLGQGGPSRFVEVKTSPALVRETPPDGIEVGLRGRRRLMVRSGFDRQLLIDLIGVLEGMA